MKKIAFIIIVSYIGTFFSCSSRQHPINAVSSSGETGTLQISVHMNRVGALRKAARKSSIELTTLYITLSADSQSTLFDTLQLSGGNEELLERKEYPGMAAYVNGAFVNWTLSVEVRDQDDMVIHSGDTTFTIVPLDTVTIPLLLNAQYSMLTANYFPIRDSVTRCELLVDGDTVADSSFAKQSLLGDTVMLSFDYLSAMPEGIRHHIDMNVYGDSGDSEMLFYTGDTTVSVISGVDTNYNIILAYVGPVSIKGTAAMVVSLGNVGKTIINGKLFAFDRYFLTMEKNGNGTVTPSDSVTHGMEHPITATPDRGFYFKKWRVTRGTAVIADSFAASTTVKLEDGNATIEALFTMELITFEQTFGGGGSDYGYSVQQTRDDGYIVAGYTTSFGSGGYDVYLVKTDFEGNVLWTRTFGGSSNDYGKSVQQTSDGGYIVAGYTYTSSARNDVYLVKTDAGGNALWTRTFGGYDYDYGNSVRQTNDGGYIIAGYTSSFGAGGYDVYLVKTDANGNALWTRTFGGYSSDYGYSVQQTDDGGYIVTGYTYSSGNGNADVYLVKTDAGGNTLWTRTVGGSSSDYGYSVQQTNDGGYIVTGYAYSSGNGNADVYLVKTDAGGNTLWTRTVGGSSYDYGYSVQQTHDGGYIIGGYTNSGGAGQYDMYLVRTSPDGNVLWTRTFGGSSYDYGYCVQQTDDGGYVIAGSTHSFGEGGDNIFLIKTDREGNVNLME